MSELQTGDLLFVGSTTEQFSQMIAQSTQPDTETFNYTHVGIVEIAADGVFVLHASPELGSVRQPLNDFIDQQTGSIDVYRLKASPDLMPVIAKANTLLGQPYNWSFIASEPGFYCSEFIETAFSAIKNPFKKIAMTFGPDDSILPEWQTYYAKLGLPVPNGEPGTNPNALISNQLERVVRLR
ncbi:YiiX/YebB-like N1pC/P60 family cysteine hydrolase [Weissella confusa]|uniref:YiiX/YebB-like N1pC/P60 family cysteine hydrolase n=1 Tax=Weissella confusa TaxID=1583 RepID=UPI0035A35AB3